MAYMGADLRMHMDLFPEADDVLPYSSCGLPNLATGNYHEGSDIDLILIFERVLGDFRQRPKWIAALYEPKVASVNSHIYLRDPGAT